MSDDECDDEFMCRLCFPDAVEIGFLWDRCLLIKNEGKYHVLVDQGHNDEFLFSLDDKPIPDPDPECEIDNCPGYDLFSKIMCEIDGLEFSPEIGHWIVENCTEKGWKKLTLGYWFANYLGEIVEKYEEKVNE